MVKQHRTTNHRFSETAERLFRNSHRRTIVNAFDEGKVKFRRWGIFIAVLGIITLYFVSPYSRINGISVEGNSILSRNYIQNVSGAVTGRPLYLHIPFVMAHKLKKDPVIQNAEVHWRKDNIIAIKVEEKKAIGYRYTDNTPEILFDDGTTAALKSAYLDVIADIPLIRGFTSDEETKALCKAFKDVSADAIGDMSEISQYSLEYDNEAICIQMRDGVYFLADYYNVFTINDYADYYARMNDKTKCLFAFSNEERNTVFETDCPWNKQETEYWTNEDGSVRTKADGTQIPKHYYTLADGSYALDGNGNKIAIPVDENGNEQADADFQAHYDAGYYATGSLVIPDDAAD